MSVIELVTLFLMTIVAVSLATIAVQLSRLVATLHSVAPLLQKYLSACWYQDGHPPHHFYHTAQDLLVWEWRDGTWQLRTSGVPAAEAGLPPNRAGSYDGECVTTRRSGTSR